MTHRDCVSLVLATLTPFLLGCPETRTPTEVAAYVAPSPSPTPVPQPASMSGFVLGYYGGPIEGATVESRGKSTITGIGGAYVLPGLLSGTSPVAVLWQEAGTTTTQDFAVLLNPGLNQVDFRVGP